MFKNLLDKIKTINLGGYFTAFIVGTFILASVAYIMENPELKEYEGGIQNHLVWDIKGQCFFVRPANNAVYLIRVNDCDKGNK